MEDLKIVNESYRPKDFKTQTLRPVVIDKEFEFDDVDKVRKFLIVSEENMEHITSGNKAKDSLYDEIVRDYEQSFFPDFESFLRRNRCRLEERDIKFISGKYNSNFDTTRYIRSY